MQYCSWLMIVFMNFLLVNHTVHAHSSTDVNVVDVSLCVLYNGSMDGTQLHYSCTSYDHEEQSGEKPLKVMDDINNTLKIPKSLCGHHEDFQEACYRLELLILKSDIERLCISADSMTFTNTSVRRTVDNNDNLHLKHCNDSESGSSTLSGYYVFNCVNFEEVDEAEFIIRGYYISGWWSATVRIILNICSTEVSETDHESYHLVEIAIIVASSIVLVTVVCIIFAGWKYYRISKALTGHIRAQRSPDPQSISGEFEFTVIANQQASEAAASVPTTDAISLQEEFQPSVPTIDARQCLKVHNPQQDTSPQGTVSSLQKHKRNAISDNTMKRRSGDPFENYNQTTQV